MSAIVFRTPLSHEEQQFYQQKFHQLDSEDLGIVTGEAAKPLLAASGLSSQVLSQIWAIVDIDNKGFLNQNEFSAAMRMIAHLQVFPSQPVSAQLYENPPSRLPMVNDDTTQVSSNNNSMIGSGNTPVPATPMPMPMGSSNSTPIPAISPNDISKYSQLYDRSANGTSMLPGDKAKDIFLKARLPNQTLGEIWALCDRDASGALTKQEFIMAMYLIQLVMANHPSTKPLPDQLAPELWNSLNQIPSSVPSMDQPLSASSTGMSSNNPTPLARQNTLSRVSSGAFSNAANNWHMTPEKKAQFDTIFDALDKNRAGALGSQVLVPFFLSSKLSQETLASVWDLADIHNNAEFTKLEFAIAMFLIQKKNAGIDLPDVIPNELLHSPALGLYPGENQQQPQPQQQQQQPAQQQYLQQPQPPLPPSRNTKPAMAGTVQPQHSNNGSLNDLMALNGSFSPQPTATKPLTHTESGNSFDSSNIANTMNMKKFNPSSTFGQSIIKEEEEKNVAMASHTATMGTNAPSTSGMSPAPPQYLPAAETVSKSVSSPVQRNSTLPKVPNFGSISNAAGSGFNAITGATGAVLGGAIGAVAGAATGTVSGAVSGANRDLFADPESSHQLSQATTEMANLSNQVNSLSNQASITSDKKSKVQKELARVNEMKANIESKLATLRAKYDQDVKETEQLEGQLTQTNRDVDGLNQQLALVEANYHASESKLNELKTQHEESQQKNSQLKEQIANFNTMIATLEAQLNEKKQMVKQEMSVVDVNSKQLEVNQVTVANLEKEISGLDQQVSVYVNKRKELDEYKKTVEEQHAQLQARYQEISDKDNELTARQQDLDEHNTQIEEQEKLYHEHVARLQTMFDELTDRQKQFEKADNELKARHYEYAQRLQDLSERQVNLAMGEMPSDAQDIINKHKENGSSSTASNLGIGAAIGAAGAAVAAGAAATVNAMTSHKEDDEKTESDVMDRDVPTVHSQSEPDESAEHSAHRSETEAANLADNFNGDMNEYGIPRTQSLTSSVANNAPQSVRDDVELPETLEEKDSKSDVEATPSASNTDVPGEWVSAQPADGTQDTSNESAPTHSESDNSIQNSLEQPEQKKKMTIDEEFPPIQELNVDESDSSSSDGEFQDTKEMPAVNSQQTQSMPQSQTYTEAPKDDFDDAFTELEKATEEEPNVSDYENVGNQGSLEAFETIDHKDLDGEMAQNNFTGTAAQTPPAHQAPQQGAKNDEWDDIFAGFGNGVKSQQMPQPVAQPASAQGLQAPPINRGIATTPKSLAVEELMGMGFAEGEVVRALESNNWDLEAATNHLLDSA